MYTISEPLSAGGTLPEAELCVKIHRGKCFLPWMWLCALVVICVQNLSIICSISVPSEQNCPQILCVPATLTTTRFPLFQAFKVIPAVGKAAQWIRSEILMFFVFFYFLDWTSQSWEKWIPVRLQSDGGDADHRRTLLSRTKISQIESNFHWLIDDHYKFWL